MKLSKIPDAQARMSMVIPGREKISGLAYQCINERDMAWASPGTLLVLEMLGGIKPDIHDERDWIPVYKPFQVAIKTVGMDLELSLLALTRDESVIGIAYAGESDEDISPPIMVVGDPNLLIFVLHGRRWAMVLPQDRPESEPITTWLREVVHPGVEEVNTWLEKIGYLQNKIGA